MVDQNSGTARISKSKDGKNAKSSREAISYEDQSNKKNIKSKVDKRSEIIAQRAEIFYNIKLWAKRVNELRPELDRASLFRGKFMDSSVMHYKPQRFYTKGLQSVLIGELDARLKDIADGKEEMISLEKQAANILLAQEKLEDKLKDREAAYLAFTKRLQDNVLAKTFARICKFWNEEIFFTMD